MNNLHTFRKNPQYVFRVGDGEDGGKENVLISLMQKHRRALRDEGEGDLSIGFVIYSLPDEYKVP